MAKRRRTPRHPAEVTADRLGEVEEKWGDRLSGRTLDDISHIKYELERIAEEDRAASQS